MATGQRQHVELHRKSMMRIKLLKHALPGCAYVPFVGDGDLAVAHYSDRVIYAADIDPARVAVATQRLPNADVRVADCDGWPFPDVFSPFAVADFDAYAYPYHAFRSFWKNAAKADRVVMFFTDGQGRVVLQQGYPMLPDGTQYRREDMTISLRRQLFNFWLVKQCLPWVKAAIAPEYRVVRHMGYKRGMMLYWGVVVEK